MLPAVARAERTAYRQIAKYGSTVTLSRPGASSVSVTGAVTVGASTEEETIGVFLPLSEYTENVEEQRSLAQRGVRYIALAARDMTLEPRPHDTITVGSDVYDVTSSTPINPAGDAIAHRVLVVKT
jgi:hypothetical protein